MKSPVSAELEGVIRRVAGPGQAPDLSTIWVDDFSASGRGRPYITRNRLLRQDQVGIVRAKGLMNSSRACVRDRYRQILCDIVLDIEGPLHHVIAMRPLFDVHLGRGGWSEQLSCAGRKTARGRVRDGADGIERSRQRGQQLEFIWQRQHVIYSEARPDRGS